MWKSIKGYKSPYRINEDGIVQKYYHNKWITLSPYLSRKCACVSMLAKDGKRKKIPVSRLMANAFMGGRKPGYCIYHKNGSKLDNRLCNLSFGKRYDVSILSAGNRRISVEKVDKDGNVLELYSSMNDASKKNFISKSAVSARCQGRIKNPFWLCDFTFRYEEPKMRKKKRKNRNS